MADIEVFQLNGNTDPNIRAIGDRVVSAVQLAAERVVANDVDPARYPLPEAGATLERILHSRFNSLDSARKAAAIARVMPRVTSPKRAAIHRELAAVDLTSPESVVDQMTRIHAAGRTPSVTLDALARLGGTPIAITASLEPLPTKLTFQLDRLICVDETGKGVIGEWGRDEIYLGATTVDDAGNTRDVPAFKVGNFNDHDVKTFDPPRAFASFALSSVNNWPRTFFVNYVLAEKDMGNGLSTYLNDLADAIRSEVAKAIFGLVGAGTGITSAGLGAAIGYAVGYALDKAIEWLKSWWSDDIFRPISACVTLPSPSSRFSNGRMVSRDEGDTVGGHNGTYQVRYSWRLGN